LVADDVTIGNALGLLHPLGTAWIPAGGLTPPTTTAQYKPEAAGSALGQRHQDNTKRPLPVVLEGGPCATAHPSSGCPARPPPIGLRYVTEKRSNKFAFVACLSNRKRRPRSPFRRGKIFGDVVQSTGFKVDEEAQDVTIQPKKEAPVTGGAPSAENSKNTLVAEGQQGKPRERMLAELGLSAILSNTTTARMFAKATFGELDLTESVGVMREKVNAVHLRWRMRSTPPVFGSTAPSLRHNRQIA
jgi:hypothetical protein